MKKILFIAFLSPTLCFAQKAHTYFQLSGDMYNYSGADPIFGGSMEIGAKRSIIGLGAGVSITQFKGATSPYVPVYFDISAYTNKREIRPILQIKGGFGIFDNNAVSTIKQSGGLYLNPSAGLLFPLKKSDIILAVGYLSSEIRSKIVMGTYATTSSTNITGWSLHLGVKL